ncbi:hypothetical protein [Mycobacterium sp. SMC-4]|uniref:hypothetical protein n=1 Tax=Mycobacterium sp. SMC-4 TaxID=2857059 RepID=UPI003D02CA1A
MSWRDWSSARIRLTMLAVVTPIMALWVVIGYVTESDEPTGDCLAAENGVRRWAAVLPDIHAGMPGDVAAATLSDATAQAAAGIRDDAETIDDLELRNLVTALAEELERVSRGDPSSPPNGWPDKNYMGGYQGSVRVVGEIKRACPEIGDELAPTG